jgi:cytochrome c oxidase subunit III
MAKIETKPAHNHDEHGHDPHLGHHFDTPKQQFESNKLGMWIFLATEVLLFGGLFCAYAVYRSNHPEIFAYAHRFLDKKLGGLNTLILICSSFTMAWAVRAAQLGERRKLIGLLAATLLFAGAFLGVKGVEYEAKWKHGLLWGKRYHPTHEHQVMNPPPPMPGLLPPAASQEKSALPPAAFEPQGLRGETAERAAGEEQMPEPKNVQTFFGIYFVMTGLHGIHVIAGMIVIAIMMIRAYRGEFGPKHFVPVDNAGLYWHLVDLIWIYLFPLLYLIH